MTDPRIEPLDAELDALLDAERRAAAPAAAALDRVWSRLERPPGAGGSDPPRGGGAAGLAPSAATVAGLAFVAGVLTGAGLHAALSRSPPQRAVYIQQPPPPPTTTVAEIPAPSQTIPTTSLSALPLVPRASALRPVSAPVASSLSAEREILDLARTALAQGDEGRALALTDEHARKFAQARLGEEREAIAIQAMVLQGRHDDARERAARFRATFPNSLFLPAVEASLASIP